MTGKTIGKFLTPEEMLDPSISDTAINVAVTVTFTVAIIYVNEKWGSVNF